MADLTRLLGASAVCFALLAGCSDKKEPLWQLDGQPSCEGAAISPLAGAHPMVISNLEIGSVDDGFDLDGDGDPDNKLAAVGALAGGPIEDAFENFEIVIPMEFFDFDTVGDDECVKFAVYLGKYRIDRDGDGEDTAREGRADCNDHDDAIGKHVAEIVGDFIDNNCDGLADETRAEKDGEIIVTPSDDKLDRDQDGVSIADGDCDDTNDKVAAGLAEVCNDGLDNNCDGDADWAVDGDGNALCSPYIDPPVEGLVFDPLGFNSDGSPVVSFTTGTVTTEGDVLKLVAGPATFSVNIPLSDSINLDLRITGARIEGDLEKGPNGLKINNARLGGVLDANTLDKITGLEVEEIGLLPEDTMLDAIFANLLGPLLALPSLPVRHEWSGCRTADVDVDQDGLEAFCDSNFMDDLATVDVCIDGDGKVYRDEAGVSCTELRDKKGNLRFVDGVSVELNFNTVPGILPASLP